MYENFYKPELAYEKRTITCEFSLIKFHYFDYLKRFINRINEVYCFQLKIAIFY